MLKEPSAQTLYSVKIPFGNEGRMKTFSDEAKLRQFITSRPTLKEMLKKVLQMKGK